MKNTRVTMYFDGACPVCRREVAHYRRIDRQSHIDWIDITRRPEALSELDPEVSYTAAMTRLHVVDRLGTLHTGVAAFACLWRELPYYRWLAPIVSLTLLEPLLDKGYDALTRWRLRGRCLQAGENTAGKCRIGQ
jgi:predicted DCC family thiol-disulfide oxidoreductase YuxK